MSLLAFVLALIWGVFWSVFLQVHPLGQFLVIRRTWITVVIGVGVNLLIGLLVIAFQDWVVMVMIFVFSSMGIIGRSLWNEFEGIRGEIDVIRRERGGKKAAGE